MKWKRGYGTSKSNCLNVLVCIRASSSRAFLKFWLTNLSKCYCCWRRRPHTISYRQIRMNSCLGNSPINLLILQQVTGSIFEEMIICWIMSNPFTDPMRINSTAFNSFSLSSKHLVSVLARTWLYKLKHRKLKLDQNQACSILYHKIKHQPKGTITDCSFY